MRSSCVWRFDAQEAQRYYHRIKPFLEVRSVGICWSTSRSEGGTRVVPGLSAVSEARLRVQSHIRPRGERGAGGGQAAFDSVLGRCAPCAPGWSLVPACNQVACRQVVGVETAVATVAGDPS